MCMSQLRSGSPDAAALATGRPECIMSLHRLPSASMFQHDAAASCGQQESKIEHFCCSSKATPCSVCDRKHIFRCAVASSCRDSRSAPASSDGARERRSLRNPTLQPGPPCRPSEVGLSNGSSSPARHSSKGSEETKMLVRIWTTCVRRPRRVWMDDVHQDSHMEELDCDARARGCLHGCGQKKAVCAS